MASIDEVADLLRGRLKAQEKKFPNILLALIDSAKSQKAESNGESLSSSLGGYYASNLDRLRNNVEEFPYASPKYSDLSVIKQYFGGATSEEEEKMLAKSMIPLSIREMLGPSVSPAQIALLETDPIVRATLNPTPKEESKSLLDVLTSYFN